MPVRRSRATTIVATTRTAEAQVVEAAAVREVDAADHGRLDARRRRAELGARPASAGGTASSSTSTANASVITARNRPRTRNAGQADDERGRPPRPRSRTITAGEPGQLRPACPTGRTARGCRGRRAARTIVSAPRPTNANWPSDSWPAHPVSSVIDSATSAKITMSVHRNSCERCVEEERQDGEEPEQQRRSRSAGAAGRTRASAGAPGSASPGPRATSRCRRGGSARRTARARARRRRGTGRRSTGRATRRWRARCARRRRRRCRRRCVIGSDCMRAISATTRARSSSEGPMATAPARDDVAGRDALQRRDQDAGDRRERAGDRPHDRRRPLDADPVDRGRCRRSTPTPAPPGRTTCAS